MGIFYWPWCRCIGIIRIQIEIKSCAVPKIPDIVGLVLDIPDFHPDTCISIAGGTLFSCQYPIIARPANFVGGFRSPTLFFFVGPEIFIVATLVLTASRQTTYPAS